MNTSQTVETVIVGGGAAGLAVGYHTGTRPSCATGGPRGRRRTAFRADFGWIDLPVFGDDGQPVLDRGVAVGEPGLYFVGMPFQYAASSEVLPGMGRDAEPIAGRIATRAMGGTGRLVPVGSVS
jgi:hypothetical protein